MELLVTLACPIIYSARLLDTAHQFVAQMKQSSTGHANAPKTLSELTACVLDANPTNFTIKFPNHVSHASSTA
jgi:hypothetical protein